MPRTHWLLCLNSDTVNDAGAESADTCTTADGRCCQSGCGAARSRGVHAASSAACGRSLAASSAAPRHDRAKRPRGSRQSSVAGTGVTVTRATSSAAASQRSVNVSAHIRGSTRRTRQRSSHAPGGRRSVVRTSNQQTARHAAARSPASAPAATCAAASSEAGNQKRLSEPRCAMPQPRAGREKAASHAAASAATTGSALSRGRSSERGEAASAWAGHSAWAGSADSRLAQHSFASRRQMTLTRPRRATSTGASSDTTRACEGCAERETISRKVASS